MTTQTMHEIIVQKQNSTKPPKHMIGLPAEAADLTLDHVKGFAYKYHMQLEKALLRFIDIDPATIKDEKLSLAISREQAKLSLETYKAAAPKEIKHTGSVERVTKIIYEVEEPERPEGEDSAEATSDSEY